MTDDPKEVNEAVDQLVRQGLFVIAGTDELTGELLYMFGHLNSCAVFSARHEIPPTMSREDVNKMCTCRES